MATFIGNVGRFSVGKRFRVAPQACATRETFPRRMKSTDVGMFLWWRPVETFAHFVADATPPLGFPGGCLDVETFRGFRNVSTSGHPPAPRPRQGATMGNQRIALPLMGPQSQRGNVSSSRKRFCVAPFRETFPRGVPEPMHDPIHENVSTGLHLSKTFRRQTFPRGCISKTFPR